MSGTAMQNESSPAWKQEINRRVAEHKRRKFDLGDEPQLFEMPRPEVSRRAQAAAARVAARYAKAPSYGDVLCGADFSADRGLAARVAEADVVAGTQPQMQVQFPEVHLPAEPALAAMEAVKVPARESLSESRNEILHEAIREATFESKFEAGPAAQVVERVDSLSAEATDDFFPPGTFPVALLPVEERADPSPDTQIDSRIEKRIEAQIAAWQSPAEVMPQQALATGGVGKERTQPRSYGLSIEELPADWVAWETAPHSDEEEPGTASQSQADRNEVSPAAVAAARKARLRRAQEMAAHQEAPLQLSIFEVDPPRIAAEPNWAVLDLQAEAEAHREEAAATAASAKTPAIELAQMHRRLLAGLVDFALVAGSVLTWLALSLRYADALPGVRELETGAILRLGAALILYQALFMALGAATPGMMYARMRLTTLDGRKPSFEERMKRFWAFLISMLPAGLGMAWCIFDEDGMAWHDRLSATYPKNRLY